MKTIWMVEIWDGFAHCLSRSHFDGDSQMVIDSVRMSYSSRLAQPAKVEPDNPGELKWWHEPTGKNIIAKRVTLLDQADHL